MQNALNEIASYLLGQSWQIAAVFLVVAGACWVLRKSSAHWRYLLWLIVLAKCLVPPLLSVPVAVLPALPTAAQKSLSAQAPAATVVLPEASVLPLAVAPSEVPVAEPLEIPPQPTFEPTIQPSLTFAQWLCVAWMAGAAAFLLFCLFKAWRTQDRLRRTRRAANADLQAEVAQLAARLGFGMVPKIWLVDGISQPFVWGLLRGGIYLPGNFEGICKAEDRRGILMHELAHVSRWDAAVNSLQVLVQAAFFFHPLVWWANRKIRQEREKCCDEVAIASLAAKPKQYGSAIVEVLVNEYESSKPVPSLAVAGPVKNIEERIKTMMRPNKKFYKRPTWLAVISVLIVAALVIPTALTLTARAEQTAQKRHFEISGIMLPKNLWDQLLLYYSFDQIIDKSKVIDLSGEGHHGQVYGAKHRVDEQRAGAMSFDGQDDYISIPELELREYSFTAWVKTSQTGRSLNNRRIFMLDAGKHFYSIEGNVGGGLSTYATQQMEVNEYDWQFAPNLWTHITVTFDGSTIKIYINGELTESGGESIFSINRALKGEARLGGNASFNGGFWQGVIDEVMLFNRALTKAEVAQLLKATGGTSESAVVGQPAERLSEGLVAYYPFEGDAKDASGKDNHGTPRDQVDYVQGRFGKAAHFDSSKGSHIDLGHYGGFDVNYLTQTVVVSAWVKGSNGVLFSDNTATGWYDFGLEEGKAALWYRPSAWGAREKLLSSRRIDDDKFHHILGVIDGYKFSLYIDGVLDKSHTFSVPKLLWSGTTPNGSSGVSIGACGFKKPNGKPEWGYFDGTVDELRIYNRELAAEEIRSLCNLKATAGSATPQPAAQTAERFSEQTQKVVGQLKAYETDLKMKLAEQRTRLGPDHVLIKGLEERLRIVRRDIASLTAKTAGSPATQPNNATEQAETMYGLFSLLAAEDDFREQGREVVIGWTGQKVAIPGPPAFPEWIKDTSEWQSWRRKKNVRTLTTHDPQGRKFVINGLGWERGEVPKPNFSGMMVYRPDGSKLAAVLYSVGTAPIEWSEFDPDGQVLLRATIGKGRRLSSASFLGADGARRKWAVNDQGIVHLEQVKTSAGDIVSHKVPTTPPVESLTFGPVIERVLDGRDQKEFLDLDSGKVFTRPSVLKTDAVTTRNWLRSLGIDLNAWARRTSDGYEWSIFGFDLALLPVSETDWDGLSATQVSKSLAKAEGAEGARISDLKQDTTVLLRTREGGMGILQIVGFTERPKGGVKIRYKMVQQAQPGKPATH